MLNLLKQLKRLDWLMVAASVACIVVMVWLDLKMPGYMSTITTLVETPGSDMNDILRNGGYMLLCAVGSMAASIVTSFFAARIAASVGRTLREKVFKKVLSFNDEEIGKFSTPSLITRTTNDITQVQMLIAIGLQALVRAPILMVWGVIKIAGKQWEWSVVTVIAVVIILAVVIIIMIFVLPRFRIIQTLTDNLNRVTRENISGIRVVRAYNAEDYQNRKFDKANTDLTRTNLFVNRVMAIMSPVMTMVMSGISLAIYWVGAYIIDASAMTDRLGIFSDMVVFSSYAMQIIMAFTLLTMMFIMLPRVMVSVRRINAVLETEVRMKNGTAREGETGQVGTIEFRNVCFRYPDDQDDVLHDISFTADKGDTIAIIGATASGKSTLINLIPRFYDVSDGEVLVDGVDVRSYDTTTLRKKIGYVAQKATLFSGTVASNVAYGQETWDDAAVKEAIDIAQASEFVDELPEGINAPIAQGGTNVSGGQKQRLSIARAVYKQAEIYIFDDSFSALDYKTDRILRDALEKKTADATKIIVAQRIGTIRNADKIIVLEDGEVAGIGTHDELMESCKTYQEIALSQLSKEELDYA